GGRISFSRERRPQKTELHELPPIHDCILEAANLVFVLPDPSALELAHLLEKPVHIANIRALARHLTTQLFGLRSALGELSGSLTFGWRSARHHPHATAARVHSGATPNPAARLASGLTLTPLPLPLPLTLATFSALPLLPLLPLLPRSG